MMMMMTELRVCVLVQVIVNASLVRVSDKPYLDLNLYQCEHGDENVNRT